MTRALAVAILLTPIVGAAAERDALAGIDVVPESAVRYFRAYFGGWRHAPGDCMDTRNRVLADESEPAALRVRGCTVRAGLWHDPYANQTFRDPRKLDVDHLVPLKEAWESGAFRWTRDARRDYANALTPPLHLIAVSLTANRQKGDRDPSDWLPPDIAYRCQYLRDWVAVKRAWRLTMDARERAAVSTGLGGCQK